LAKSALTAASVERIKPPAKGQKDIFDRGYPGLALRVSYGGRKSFVYFYRLGGKLRRLTLGMFRPLAHGETEPEAKLGNPITLKGARDLWRAARQDAQAGRDPSNRRAGVGSTNFKGVFEEWMKRDQSNNRSQAVVRRNIERDVLPFWDGRQIGDIGRRDILDVIDAVVDRGSPVMARRLYASLHRLFKWAVGRGIIELNPVANLPKPGREIRRDRVLTDDETVAVWNAAPRLGWPHGDVVRLLLLTGARREEIGGLRWSEIDVATIKLKGERTKNGDARDIPLSRAGIAILEAGPRIAGSEFVFGAKPVKAWPKAKVRLDELSGVTSWRIHDLRRTAATGLQKLGTPLQVTEAILGHTAGSRAGVVGVYQRHDYADEKRAALEAWGAHVVSLVEGKEPGKVVAMRGEM
jgi:integrase